MSGLIGFLSFLLFVFYQRPSKLKSKGFLFNWFRPRKENRGRYFVVILLNTLFALLLILYNSVGAVPAPKAFVSFALATTIMFGFSFAVLTKDRSPRYRAFLGAVIVITGCLLFFQGQVAGFEGVDILLLALFILLPLLVLAAGKRLFHFFMVPAFFPFKERFDFKRMYVIMLFSFLFINGFLSTFTLYAKLYKQEFIIMQRQTLFELSQSIDKRNGLIEERYSTVKDLLDRGGEVEDSIRDLRKKGMHFTGLDYEFTEEKRQIKENGFCARLWAGFTEPDSADNVRLETMLARTKSVFNGILVSNFGFSFSNSADSSWNSHVAAHAAMDAPLSTCLDHKELLTGKENRSFATAAPVYFNPFKSSFQPGNAVFLAFLLILFFALYYWLRYTIKRTFTWDLIVTPAIFDIDDNLTLNDLIGNGKNSLFFKNLFYKPNLFVVSMPFAGKGDICSEENFHDTKSFSLSQLYISKNFREISGSIEDIHGQQVVLEHFGYNSASHVVNNRKLQWLLHNPI